MFKKSIKNYSFYKRLVFLTVPVTVQNLISASLSMSDTFMLGKIGQTQMAAVGLANRWTFVFYVTLFGIISGGAIFTAQYWGKKDIENIRRVTGFSIILGSLITVLFVIPCIIRSNMVMHLFSNDKDVIYYGSIYLRIIAPSYLLSLITNAYTVNMRSIGQLRVPTYINCICAIVNIVLNALLIFGIGFFPQLSVTGAALATLISRFLETTLIIAYIYYNNSAVALRVNSITELSYDLIKRIVRTSFPVLLNEIAWVTGITMYSVVFGKMGTSEFAAVNIAMTFQDIAFASILGIASAALVIIGNEIGSDNNKDILIFAKRICAVGVGISIMLGIFFVTVSPFLLNAFNISSKVYNYSLNIMYIFAIVFPFRAFNCIVNVGVFRGGGDTKTALILDTGGVWLVGVPLSILGGWIWHFNVDTVYMLSMVEELIKSIIIYKRLISGKWINSLISESIQLP